MVIDSSAVVAMFLDEPECAYFANLIAAADVRLISAVSVVETGMLLDSRLGTDAVRDFELFLDRIRIEVVPVDHGLAWRALAAFRRYGRGRHPAGLNLGDCFVYALAKSTGEPLLAKGNDFPQTDLSLCPAMPAQ